MLLQGGLQGKRWLAWDKNRRVEVVAVCFATASFEDSAVVVGHGAEGGTGLWWWWWAGSGWWSSL